MPLQILAYIFIGLGASITVLFWLPKVVNHQQLRRYFGKKYQLIYLFYFTNGPFLLAVGLYLLWFQGR